MTDQTSASSRPDPDPDFLAAHAWRMAGLLAAFVADLMPGNEVEFPSLLPGEAQKLGGYLFPDVCLFVTQVGEALQRLPRHFPGTRVTGEQFLARQALADEYMDLVKALEILLWRARQSYLKTQGEVSRDALGVLDQLRHEAHVPSLTRIERAEREVELVPARLTWGRWQARKQRGGAARTVRPHASPAQRALGRAKLAARLEQDLAEMARRHQAGETPAARPAGPHSRAVRDPATPDQPEPPGEARAAMPAEGGASAQPPGEARPALPGEGGGASAQPPLIDRHSRAWLQRNLGLRQPR